jgi:hypothetical protein
VDPAVLIIFVIAVLIAAAIAVSDQAAVTPAGGGPGRR